MESFLKYMNRDEKLHKFYGQFYARKVSVGGKLFIKEFNSATKICGWLYILFKLHIKSPR